PEKELQAEVSAPAGAQSGPQPRCGTLTTYELPGVTPGAVAVEEDGSVWFTDPKAGALGHMTVAGKVTRRFISAQLSQLVRAPNGDLWGIDRGGNSVWQISPGKEPRRHPVPTATGREGAGSGGPYGSGLSDIAVGAGGNVWFVETEADKVGRITPDGQITEVPLFGPGDGYLRPSSLSPAPDGSVWVSAPLGRRIVRVDGRTLAIRNVTVPHPGGTVIAHSLAVGPGGDVWFGRPSPSAMEPAGPSPALGRRRPDGSLAYHVLPGGGRREPGALTAGPDGAIWFLDAPAGTLGRMAADGTLTEFALSGGMYDSLGGRQLAAGADSVWFAQPGRLGRISCR
ncbi:MAG TPA: hypothetical protein VEG38_19375, partial [Acidimicrobiia bacterium]|nr:hypothetical protein [Acidimicrobiia bacterium]